MAHLGPGDGMLHRPRALAATFDAIGTAYEGRPGYPGWVYGRLVGACGLRPGAAVLEVGPGAGQATLPLLDHGAQVTAVEPGAALARHLTERTRGRGAEVVVSRFEDFDVPEAAYDLVVSATAFHWVDPDAGLAGFARGLRDLGWLALWWTVWGDPDRPDPFREALDVVLADVAPHLLQDRAGSRAHLQDLDARVARVDRTSSFGPVTKEVCRWEGEHDPIGLRDLFNTFSGWIALEEGVRATLLTEVERLARTDFAGVVRRPYLTMLYRAQRRGR